ncbi:TdiA protein [Blastomyces dermatitidis ATCC 18188]|uniref:TdiA protein n=1 Tax=Ajellomyces dermatitidis (strain ATCC 18188 / CBS 674.68) TaxID=653446 RepID=F2TKV7_AJEDA|nr:TdiA protein [Blastomyces dermatitidis ATCC 18188]
MLPGCDPEGLLPPTSLNADLATMATKLMVCQNLTEILESSARYCNAPIEFHHADFTIPSKVLTTRQLRYQAHENAQLIRDIHNVTEDTIVLIHFDNHEQNIIWLWSTVIGGYLPAMSPAFVNDLAQRRKHILHLNSLFKVPLILTSDRLVHEFLNIDGLHIVTVERLVNKLRSGVSRVPRTNFGHQKEPEDAAILMLTSGSTGNAKAAVLRNNQIKAALAGKVAHHGTEKGDVFLGWVALDHVASLCQIHLHALALGARQIFVDKADVANDPLRFLNLIHNLRVSVTFGPNFFLTALSNLLDKMQPSTAITRDWDLSCLKVIFSGGEANTVQTCISAMAHLETLGARKNVVSPGFGMTETCAGSMHNLSCPDYDIKMGLEFTSVGPCIPGLAARVAGDNGLVIKSPNVPGALQIKGECVLKEYFNDPFATSISFTRDGWFITGDTALIDDAGYVRLCGRTKDLIIVNGVNYYPHELERAIEEAKLPGLTPTYTVVFSHRPDGASTERVVVVFSPAHGYTNAASLTVSFDAISKITARLFGVSPYQIVPVAATLIPKSTLGKISSPKIAAEYRAGGYDTYYAEAAEAIKLYRQTNLRRPESETQKSIADLFAEMFHTPSSEIGIDTSLLDMGVSSIELFAFKSNVHRILCLDQEIPLISVLMDPTIHGIATAIQEMQQPKQYNPVVKLHASGEKPPLWLVHPGVGEVLVFLNLAKYINDRPLYALRARGFEEGEEFFKDLPEIFTTYFQHIKTTQPLGPYAIAGYSFGAMIAFEVAKLLEADGDEVRFLGSFNLPPHIKDRMRQLDWVEAGINLSYFLDLISEDYAHEISPKLHELSNDDALDHLMSHASQGRLAELSLTKSKMKTWITLAHKMQEAALEYEPSGSAASIDVFHAIPLKQVAVNGTDWIENKLSKWADFSREPPRMHHVDGAHYTMMSPEHVFTFQKTLQKALRERGL